VTQCEVRCISVLLCVTSRRTAETVRSDPDFMSLMGYRCTVCHVAEMIKSVRLRMARSNLRGKSAWEMCHTDSRRKAIRHSARLLDMSCSINGTIAFCYMKESLVNLAKSQVIHV
jgi:hypothetical protein